MVLAITHLQRRPTGSNSFSREKTKANKLQNNWYYCGSYFVAPEKSYYKCFLSQPGLLPLPSVKV
jgi:hypothetical protein